MTKKENMNEARKKEGKRTLYKRCTAEVIRTSYPLTELMKL